MVNSNFAEMPQNIQNVEQEGQILHVDIRYHKAIDKSF